VQRCEKDGECAHNLKKLQRSCGASSESLWTPIPRGEKCMQFGKGEGRPLRQSPTAFWILNQWWMSRCCRGLLLLEGTMLIQPFLQPPPWWLQPGDISHSPDSRNIILAATISNDPLVAIIIRAICNPLINGILRSMQAAVSWVGCPECGLCMCQWSTFRSWKKDVPAVGWKLCTRYC
jgi:hypothetical protein